MRFSLAAAILFSFSSTTSAATPVSSCESINCGALNTAGQYQCPIYNFTLSSLGASEITTPLSSNPFALTIGQQVRPHATTPNTYLVDRHFFVGVPQEVKRELGEKKVGGCVLVSSMSQHQFPKGSEQRAEDRTCSAAMGERCVNDMKKLVKSILGKMQTMSCDELGRAFYRRAGQTSCGYMSWGQVGWNDLQQVPFIDTTRDTCHPTTRKDYHISYVSTLQTSVSSLPESNHSFLTAVTPAITVLWRDPADKETVDVQMACLRPYGSETQLADEGSSEEMSGPVITDPKQIFVGLPKPALVSPKLADEEWSHGEVNASIGEKIGAMQSAWWPAKVVEWFRESVYGKFGGEL